MKGVEKKLKGYTGVWRVNPRLLKTRASASKSLSSGHTIALAVMRIGKFDFAASIGVSEGSGVGVVQKRQAKEDFGRELVSDMDLDVKFCGADGQRYVFKHTFRVALRLIC